MPAHLLLRIGVQRLARTPTISKPAVTFCMSNIVRQRVTAALNVGRNGPFLEPSAYFGMPQPEPSSCLMLLETADSGPRAYHSITPTVRDVAIRLPPPCFRPPAMVIHHAGRHPITQKRMRHGLSSPVLRVYCQ